MRRASLGVCALIFVSMAIMPIQATAWYKFPLFGQRAENLALRRIANAGRAVLGAVGIFIASNWIVSNTERLGDWQSVIKTTSDLLARIDLSDAVYKELKKQKGGAMNTLYATAAFCAFLTASYLLMRWSVQKCEEATE